jgi:hypothetical protein
MEDKNQQAVALPEGEESPAVPSIGEKEKVLPPLTVTEDHPAPVAKEDFAKEIIVSPALSPTRPSIDVS